MEPVFGRYEVLGVLGRGGMGVVYRARDPRLRREVAIKALPELVKDPRRRERLEREARALAALSHPAIATLYGVEDDGDQSFLVMELVEGETLAERLTRGRLTLDDARSLFIPIAEALESAHGKGILHRDLKPANILITEDGRPKLLDFGLAKALADEPSSEGETASRGLTEAGGVVGTPAYMAPEQASGGPVDQRCDVWSFGCVLFESLAGRVPGLGTPDWTALPAETPTSIRRLLRRCLETKPSDRLRHLGDAVLELKEAEQPPAPRRVGSAVARLLPWAVALLAVVLVVMRPPATPPLKVSRFSIATGTLPVEDSGVVALSSDGRLFAFVRRGDGGKHWLSLRHLGSYDVEDVLEIESEADPFFSPDGEWIAFFGPQGTPESGDPRWRPHRDGRCPELGGKLA